MAGLIGLDWGTSSLRAYWLDAGSDIIETRTRPWGIRHLPQGGFDAALREITSGWPAVPLIACGMVGSRNGWVEVPYLELPTEPAQLGAALHCTRTGDNRELHIVPGLHTGNGPDVMRGEETQLVGALASQPDPQDRCTWILPGTHSKWVSTVNGAVSDFCTMMTGELFAVLRQHSLLGAGIEAGDPDPEAFRRGVLNARNSGVVGAMSRLFSARTLVLDGELPAASVPDYLSGLLLGEELRANLATGRFAHDRPIQLIGDVELCARYRDAAACFDIPLAEPLVDAAAHGLWQLARQAGLINADNATGKEISAC